jgi:uncharacterized protein (DUF2062 family)
MRPRLRRAFQVLFQVEDTPHRIALAFGLGVFIAFSPLLGIHTGMALALAFLLRLSRVAILAGAWTNNPWTLAPMFTAGTALGCGLLGVSADSLEAVDWGLHGREFYGALWEGLRPLVLPFVVGNTVLGVVAGALAYVLLRSLLERRRTLAEARRG